MFHSCESLVSVDLFKTITTKIKSMSGIFDNCILLTSIDLSNLVSTTNLDRMGSAFKNCVSLVYVNLSNLVTNKVRNMDFMFYNCISLTSLNLSNFDTSQVTYIESMFDGCIKLEYINLKNVEEKKQNLNYLNIFRGIPENIVICLNETAVPNLSLLIKNKTCYSIDCNEDWKQKQKNMVNDTEKCVKSCKGFLNHIYEDNDKCYLTCFCEQCNENYYPKENDENIIIHILIVIKTLKSII